MEVLIKVFVVPVAPLGAGAVDPQRQVAVLLYGFALSFIIVDDVGEGVFAIFLLDCVVRFVARVFFDYFRVLCDLVLQVFWELSHGEDALVCDWHFYLAISQLHEPTSLPQRQDGHFYTPVEIKRLVVYADIQLIEIVGVHRVMPTLFNFFVPLLYFPIHIVLFFGLLVNVGLPERVNFHLLVMFTQQRAFILYI